MPDAIHSAHDNNVPCTQNPLPQDCSSLDWRSAAHTDHNHTAHELLPCLPSSPECFPNDPACNNKIHTTPALKSLLCRPAALSLSANDKYTSPQDKNISS